MTHRHAKQRRWLGARIWLPSLLSAATLIACGTALPVEPVVVAAPTVTRAGPTATAESLAPTGTATSGDLPQPAAPTATAPGVSAGAGSTPLLTPRACPFRIPTGLVEGESLECGEMRVPQDRRQPDGITVAIPYALIRSAAVTPRPDPLVYLVGGPGGSALLDLPTIYGWFESLRDERDILLFDQRGTILGYPVLDCDRDADEIDLAAERARVERTVPEQYHPVDDSALVLPTCARRLAEQGVDLTQYNSAANARDTLDLVRALGYSEFNLYGTSYGTRLALTIIRDAPPGLRAVVLDSTLPPQINAYERLASKRYEVALSVFDQCAAELACATAFPDLKDRYVRLLERLERATLRPGDPSLPPLDRDELIEFLIEIVDAGAAAYAPRMIDELDRGVTDTYLQLRRGEIPKPESSPTAAPPDLDYEAAAEFVARLNHAFNDIGDGPRRAEASAALQSLTRREPDRDALAELIRAYLPADDAAELLQRLTEISNGGLQEIYRLLIGPATSRITGGANLAVECHEEIPFNDFATAMVAHRALGLPDSLAEFDLEFVRGVYAQCALWPAGRAPAIETAPVRSEVPVLMLQGLSDVVTPPGWATTARESLRRAQYIAFGSVGHDVTRSAPECAVEIAEQYLNDPDAPVDPSCAEQFRVRFATASES